MIPGLLFLIWPQVIARIYTDDPGLVAVASGFVRIGGIFQVFDGLQVVGVGVLRGLKDTRVPFINSLLSNWLIGTGVGLGLAFGIHQGPHGIWYGMVAAIACAASLHITRFSRLCIKVCGSDHPFINPTENIL